MKQYIVDAFSDRLFSGNPAAVCLPGNELPEDLMQNIARENNLSETAFVFRQSGGGHGSNGSADWKLRWFTPGGEVDLCGHATLATAYEIMNYVNREDAWPTGNTGVVESVVSFDTLSGRLEVRREGELYLMDFPAYHLCRVEVSPEMSEALGAVPDEAYIARDLLCVFNDEEIVRNMRPDMERLCSLDGLLVNVTAPCRSTVADAAFAGAAGRERSIDCVSRSFAPKLNVPEDPVCGSGHCHIVPYWAARLGKNDIVAYQASARGGTLYCRMHGDRVILGGHAVLFSVGDICI